MDRGLPYPVMCLGLPQPSPSLKGNNLMPWPQESKAWCQPSLCVLYYFLCLTRWGGDEEVGGEIILREDFGGFSLSRIQGNTIN